MTWVRLDDGFPEHRKVIGLTDPAFAMYVRGLCFAARNLTDGHIPTRAIRTLTTARYHAKLAGELVVNGLWETALDGFSIHGYLDFNPSREMIERDRKADVQRHRAKRDQLPIPGGIPADSERIPGVPSPSPSPEEEEEGTAAASSSSPGPGDPDGRVQRNPLVAALSNAFEAEGFGLLTPFLGEEFGRFAVAHPTFPVAWVADAFREATAANVRRWSYVRAILERWAIEGRGDVRRNGQGTHGATLDDWSKLPSSARVARGPMVEKLKAAGQWDKPGEAVAT